MPLGSVVIVILGVLLVALGVNMTRRTAAMRGSLWKQEWTPDTGFATPKGAFTQAGLGALFVGGLLIVLAFVWALLGA